MTMNALPNEFEQRQAEFNKRMIPFECVEVDPHRFKPVLAAVLDVVARHPTYEVEFNASCGTRIMAGALHLAASVIGAPIVIVGDSQKNDEYEMTVIGQPTDAILTAGRRKILAALADLGGSSPSIRAIALETGLSDGQTSRQVNALHRAGYVIKKGAKPQSVSLTEVGRIVLRVKQLRKERGWGKGRE
jgi:CRISPR locus-related DNA-binding protein